MIELDEGTAAILLDMAEMLSGPLDSEGAVDCLLMARAAKPVLQEAFEHAGTDPEQVERPPLGKIVPGSKAL